MKNRIKIAIDIDEVLAPFLDYFSDYYNNHWKGKRGIDKVETKNFFSYHFSDVLKVSDQISNDIVNEFQESEIFKNQKPFEDCFEALKKLKKKYDLYVVTSRSFEQEKQTRNLIEKNFPGIFKSIEFGNSYGTYGLKRGKGEICESLGCKLLVDDSPKYCNQVAKKGFFSVLFGNYAWNDEKLYKLEEGVFRASNWEETVSLIEKLLQ